jgi:hypothetical protein
MRAIERSIPHDEIDLVHRFGEPIHAGGVLRITLDGIVRPPDVLRWTWTRAASVVVIQSVGGWILTVYRRPREAPFQM